MSSSLRPLSVVHVAPTMDRKTSLLAVALGVGLGKSRKILALHGGDMSGAGFCNDGGINALKAAFPNDEFVCPDGGFGGSNQRNRLWIPDPPGGKGVPTTDPNVAAASMAVLDNVVANQGPFWGILGYSQGAAMVPVYLSHAPANTFQAAMMFCGYLTETHQGLLNSVTAASPFNSISALVWMGQQDWIINNDLSISQAGVFSYPTIVTSASGSHAIPTSSDSTFSQVTAWMATTSTVQPTSSPTAPTTIPTLLPGATQAPTATPSEAPTADTVQGDPTQAPTDSPLTSAAKHPALSSSSPLTMAVLLMTHFSCHVRNLLVH